MRTLQSTAEVRKTVTAVFCDVTGSTVLAEQIDAEALRHLMEQYFAAVSAVLTRHGGTVEKFVGDAVMAVFGAPLAHEDDALRACRAAVEIFTAVGEGSPSHLTHIRLAGLAVPSPASAHRDVKAGITRRSHLRGRPLWNGTSPRITSE